MTGGGWITPEEAARIRDAVRDYQHARFVRAFDVFKVVDLADRLSGRVEELLEILSEQRNDCASDVAQPEGGHS